MTPELIVVNGPSAGAKYSLRDDTFIGRAPNLDVAIPEPEVGWRHCQISKRGDRYALNDLRTSAGTYVNGSRCSQRWLEDGDQIGIGRTILMFRSATAAIGNAAAAKPEPKPVLLSACSLGFLFRALAASGGGTQSSLLKRQIIRVIGDLIPIQAGFVVLGASLPELVERFAAEYESSGIPQPFLDQLAAEGASSSIEHGTAGVPLYVDASLTGVLIVQIAAAERSRLDEHLETLTAIASLASLAFEANREVETLRAEKALLEEQIVGNAGIVGNSAPIRRLLELIERVAPRDTTVLITGESGTGKELIARALHEKSVRRNHPFIAVNCAALSENLFESELFGHEKGAFTGAIATKRGRFELAEHGTIFLDEVGELALPLQAKLLRVLQQREFERVGGTQVHNLDIRVIAATNRDLTVDVKESRFREDLYHRLNVVTLQSPPLRDRKEDIPVLSRYFLQRSAQRCKRNMQGITSEAEDILVQYAWPGNVRELENAMERAVVLGVSDWVLPEDLPEMLLESAPESGSTRYHSSVGQAKREAILDAYVQGNGDYKAAAKVLGLHPNYLLRLVRNMNLREDINRMLSASAAGR